MDKGKVVILGAGFSGLSTGAYLAQAGYDVTILEKNDTVGGRARMKSIDGFHFDMGPSWYWMPDVMEAFFADFGKEPSDYFKLTRLDPSYQVIFSKDDIWEIPADYQSLREDFERIEPGSGSALDNFVEEARIKYEISMKDFVHRPSLHITEFINLKTIKAGLKMDLTTSMSKHLRKYFRNPKILQLLEFPVLFLGATPMKIPAMYSIMNYADIKLGTWYPQGGFVSLAKAMAQVATEHGCKIVLNQAAVHIDVDNGVAKRVTTADNIYHTDFVISSADYHHTETQLLDKECRNYSDAYWDNRIMAPSCLLYYIGVDKRLDNLLHHNLFFENEFITHAHTIYDSPSWPDDPLFYVCCPSKTDDTVAPMGKENLFLLIPVAPGLEDTDEIREKYLKHIIDRLEIHCNTQIKDAIVVKESFAYRDFVSEYNSFKGNAYGLANTLSQTAILKPSIKNKKVKNLYYTGQLTVPGPGVPPSIISGKIVASLLQKENRK